MSDGHGRVHRFFHGEGTPEAETVGESEPEVVPEPVPDVELEPPSPPAPVQTPTPEKPAAKRRVAGRKK